MNLVRIKSTKFYSDLVRFTISTVHCLGGHFFPGRSVILTRFVGGRVKSDSCVASELFGDGPELGFSCRMTRCTVPHSENTRFTPS